MPELIPDERVSGKGRPPSRRRLTRATFILLALSAGLYLAGEAAAIEAQRFSRYYTRIRHEAHAAQLLRQSAPGRPRTILFVGNSLLYAGIDFDRLNRLLGAKFRAERFSIFGTTYYNWLYGLKRLYRHGMRPNYLVLCLSASHFAGATVPDLSSADFLFDARDIWQLSRDLRADATTTSNLYFSHFSVLYGAGPELRASLLEKLVGSPGLFGEMTPADPPIPYTQEVIPVIAPRLAAVRKLCESHGSTFLYLVPPTREAGDTALLAAAQLSGTRILHPIANLALGPEYYDEDDYHLNPKGAATFTRAIAEELRRLQ